MHGAVSQKQCPEIETCVQVCTSSLILEYACLVLKSEMARRQATSNRHARHYHQLAIRNRRRAIRGSVSYARAEPLATYYVVARAS